MLDTLFSFLLRCPHQRTTFPLTPRRGAGLPARKPYVACLDCGKEFAYDWATMRVGPQLKASQEPAKPPAIKPRAVREGHT
jgi:hypothetical protein